MKRIKLILSLIPPFFLWLILCVLVWGSVFVRITDAAPEDKLVICVDAAVPGDTALASALERVLDVRMVQARPFSYAMFDGDALRRADLFIVPASHVDAYRDWFAPLPAAMDAGEGALWIGGVALGCLAYDAASDRGAAADCIAYRVPGGEAEDYYLFFGAESRHNPELEGAVDGLALDAARLLLDMQ